MDVLLLCTANQCRSPMAEVLLRRRLEKAGIPARVTSAGLYPGGRPATAHGVAAMAARGLDLQGHRSRQLDRSLIERADLVIGMAREHVREVALLDRAALDRTFTLKEIVQAGERTGPRRPEEPLEAWLARVRVGRRRDDLVGVGYDGAFDVDDPVGRGRPDYEATADLLDQLLTRFVELAWPATATQEEHAS